MLTLNIEYINYTKELSMCGISNLDKIDENYNIFMKEETFYKNGRKNFPKKADEIIDFHQITTRNLANYCTSILIFKDKVTKYYSDAGYVVRKLTCISPNKEIKIIRTFSFLQKNN